MANSRGRIEKLNYTFGRTRQGGLNNLKQLTFQETIRNKKSYGAGVFLHLETVGFGKFALQLSFLGDRKTLAARPKVWVPVKGEAS